MHRAGPGDLLAAVSELYTEKKTVRAFALTVNAWERFAGHGPYRFNDDRSDFRFYLDNGVHYWRGTEAIVPQAISQWYLGHGATVGYHTITGMNALNRLLVLREQGNCDFAIWPFEDVGKKNNVIVESYPAICRARDIGPCRTDHERDALKVLRHVQAANDAGKIRDWFALPGDLPNGTGNTGLLDQIRFEGWIFGLR